MACLASTFARVALVDGDPGLQELYAASWETEMGEERPNQLIAELARDYAYGRLDAAAVRERLRREYPEIYR